MKNELIQIDEDNIKNKIYVIRGKEVMLDSEIVATKWHTIKSLIYLTLKAFIKLILYYQY